MDSKVVNREIRSHIWPLLKEAGFDYRTTRSAWRHHGDRIDVVNFQSFNKYNADTLGVTPYSFAVNLGCYLCYVPPQSPPKKGKDNLIYPEECECQFRGGLIPKKLGTMRNPTIWSVKKNGGNLSACIQDVTQQVPAALAWFEWLSDRREVLRILLDDDISMPKLWGFGRKASPFRSYLTGYVALSMGNDELAHQELKEAVASECFSNLFSSVEEARQRAI